MPHFIYGLAADSGQARIVVQHLTAIGITSDQISVLAANNQDTNELAADVNAKTAHGSFSGGNIGASLGWLAGLGALAIPGIGLFVAAGPILGFLTGIAVGRSVGNLNGAMIEEMGIPDASVPLYKEGLNKGQIVISVKLQDQALSERVLSDMRQTGVADVGTRSDEVSQHT